MKIHFYGAASTVTGTQHLVEVNGTKILLDCGLFQGKREESFRINKNLPYNAAEINLLVLSHAHIDHSGNIPNLVKSGFKGDILCTSATRDLATLMLRDSAHIQEQDCVYANKKRAKQNLPPVEPLYTLEDTEKSLFHFVGTGYGKTREIAPGVSLTFHDAGHILGSAFVVLDVEDRGKKRAYRLLFSGDLGRKGRPIIKDPEYSDGTDVLIIESTYGDRVHEEAATSEERLREIIAGTFQRGGKVIVPSFAVGRTQELVYLLHRLVTAKKLPESIPVFVDSPLAVDATAIYRLHPEVWDSETAAFLRETSSEDPFGFSMMQYTRSKEESIRLNQLKQPAVIISASGMAETGRILHHLKNNIEDSRNTILFVGFQAPDTLGCRLVEKATKVKIFGEEYNVKARVEKIDGLSAHADKNELLDWLNHFKKTPKHSFVVHGEASAAKAFKEALTAKGYPDVYVPVRGDEREVM